METQTPTPDSVRSNSALTAPLPSAASEYATLKEVLDSGVKLTPMMMQYTAIKKKHPDTLLFFRMGDFYELFFDDAVRVSRLLNIALTHRGKLGEFRIPMAGIPYHSANSYVDRLTNHGLKVAICEQVENPKAAQGIVKREVVQIVGPGIPFDLEKSDSSEYRYLGCSFPSAKGLFLVLIDFTTGEFLGMKCESEAEFLEKLHLFSPREVITHLGQWEKFPLVAEYLSRPTVMKTHLSEEYFTVETGKTYIKKLIPAYERDEIIKLNPEILSPVAALAYYICSTQIINDFYHIRPFRMEAQQGRLKVTLPTLTGLEILPRSRDKELYRESLLGYFDRTKTRMGARELKYFFQSPSADIKEITQRQDVVAFFMENADKLETAREGLAEVRDLERIMAKISTRKANPGDLLNLGKGIVHYGKMARELKGLPGKMFGKVDGKELDALQATAKKISLTINDELGASLEKGNLIKAGVDPERDRLRQLGNRSAEGLTRLEAKYRKLTQIPNLKVKWNNISGHFIEVSKSQLEKVPKSFERRQTLVNGERFITKELMEYEKEVVSAKEKLERLERQIFDNLIGEISLEAPAIISMARELGTLDVFQSLAWVSWTEDFIRPELHPDKKILDVKGVFHPLIKSKLTDQFVAHDLHLDDKAHFGLITGPNMAGKTTVMREMAIVQFLAQIGSFVPAKKARLGICDYLFSRLGASDDIQKGQSTFMVEMSETAEILRHASNKSLIIMDEVGRGTSTYDGLSIAWALVEHFIHKTRALTLFSTHYHELIGVVNKSKKAKNLTVETVVNNGDVQFLYRLVEGSTAQSFGIFVAKLAGLPSSVLHRSQELLASFENPAPVENIKEPAAVCQFREIQLSIFPNECEQETSLDQGDQGPGLVPQSSSGKNPIVLGKLGKTAREEVLERLEKDVLSMNVMGMTPMEALDRLHRMQVRIQENLISQGVVRH